MLLVASLAACSDGSKTGEQIAYDIQGTWNEGAGQWVRLVSEKSPQAVDSVQVGDDKQFHLQGHLDYAQKATLLFGKQGADYKERRAQAVILDGTPVKLTVEHEEGNPFNPSGIKTKVEGSPEQTLLDQQFSIELMNMFIELGEGTAKDEESKARARKSREDFNKTLFALIDSARNCRTITYLISDFMVPRYPIKTIDSLYNTLGDNVKQSQLGRDLADKIARLKAVNIGAQAPDFTLPTVDGGEFHLSDLRGKVVLLDFWASWCGPCRGELPNVKKIYEKHHADGLEVVGISLDNNRDKWIKAIEEEQLPWIQVSSLKAFDCAVAKQYSVQAIPRMFILDRDGKIIDLDLRGEKLAQRMDEIFAK